MSGLRPFGFDFTKVSRTTRTREKCPPHLKPTLRRIYWNDLNNGECFCCGKAFHYDDAEVGHILAASKGGQWSDENCRLICRTCNSGMGNENMKNYMKKTFPRRFNLLFKEEIKQIKTKKTAITKKKSSRSNVMSFNIPKLKN